MTYDEMTPLQQVLWGLALAENPGDVADELLLLADWFGIERPEYDGDKGRLVWSFEPTDEDEDR